MDWLRSEDLKEVKLITTSVVTVTRLKVICLPQIELWSIRARHGTMGRESQEISRPKQHAPKSSGNGEAERVLVVEHDVEK
jgi:hypothetical protein